MRFFISHSQIGSLRSRNPFTMAGSRKIQLCHLVLLVGLALLSLSSVCAAENAKHSEKQYLDWVERNGEEFKASSKVTTSVPTTTSVPPTSVTIIIITVDLKKSVGNGNFHTVQQAINSIADGSIIRYLVKIAAGIYKEKVDIPATKGPITLQGAGMNLTKITFSLDNKKANGTLASSSVSVSCDDFIAKDITFENGSPSPPPGAVGKQAVAFMIKGDKGAFWRVAFLGYQDTLYDKLGRHYFKDCFIRGTIDFIFGDGKSYYENCYLDSVSTSFGSITAQKREVKNDTSGFTFVNSVVNGTGYSYLGRAWGSYSRVVFIRTYMTAAIRPEGWYDWGIPGREKTVFYGEYECYGPGSNRAGRVPWSYNLSDAQVQPFLTTDWIQGKLWLPTGPQ